MLRGAAPAATPEDDAHPERGGGGVGRVSISFLAGALCPPAESFGVSAQVGSGGWFGAALR